MWRHSHRHATPVSLRSGLSALTSVADETPLYTSWYTVTSHGWVPYLPDNTEKLAVSNNTYYYAEWEGWIIWQDAGKVSWFNGIFDETVWLSRISPDSQKASCGMAAAYAATAWRHAYAPEASWIALVSVIKWGMNVRVRNDLSRANKSLTREHEDLWL